MRHAGCAWGRRNVQRSRSAESTSLHVAGTPLAQQQQVHETKYGESFHRIGSLNLRAHAATRLHDVRLRIKGFRLRNFTSYFPIKMA